MADSSQLTQGGSKVDTSPICAETLLSINYRGRGPVQNYVILTEISEQPDLRKGILK